MAVIYITLAKDIVVISIVLFLATLNEALYGELTRPPTGKVCILKMCGCL